MHTMDIHPLVSESSLPLSYSPPSLSFLRRRARRVQAHVDTEHQLDLASFRKLLGRT